jgi:Flp pilus assembly protein TadD
MFRYDPNYRWQKTLSIQPGDLEAHVTLGDALVRKGQVDEALAQYETALQLVQARGNDTLAAKIQDKINKYQPAR